MDEFKINEKFFKLMLLGKFLKSSHEHKQQLLIESFEKGGTDPVIMMRRFRMIEQLCQYESQIVSKIYKSDINQWTFLNNVKTLEYELYQFNDRST